MRKIFKTNLRPNVSAFTDVYLLKNQNKCLEIYLFDLNNKPNFGLFF